MEAQPAQFTFVPTSSSGVFQGQAQLGGVAASGSDWIAAFDATGNCAGAAQLILNGGVTYINLPIYGDDPTTVGVDEGIGGGETFSLKLWSSATGTIYDYPSSANVNQFTGWTNTNGSPLPGYNNPLAVFNFTLATPLTISSISPTNVACNGASTGSIDITVSGGQSPYTFSWNNGATTEDLTGISAGTYNCTVTDANGQTASSGNISVTEPTALSASATSTNVTCNGGTDGAVTLSATGGTSGYTYAWSNGSTTVNLSNVAVGSYTCTVTDANGCTATSNTVTITEPAALSASAAGTNVSCNGQTDGGVTLSVIGGLSFTYAWSNGATTSAISNLAAGSYSCTVTNPNGCTAISNTVTITEPTALSASATSTNVTCNGGTNGAVTLSATGGTSGYTYAWSNGSTTANLSNVAAGSYTCTVTDANGCTATSNTVNITEPTAINATASSTDISCNGATDGTVTLNVSGGAGGSTGSSVIIGTSLDSNSTLDAGPVNIYYRSLRYQTVYTAAELTTAGATPGNITELGWNVSSAPIYGMPNYTISIKHTTAPDASSHDGTGLTQVYNNTLYTPVAGGFDMLTFQVPFSWNGTDNILVDICFDLVNPNWDASGVTKTYAAINGSRYIEDDNFSQCGAITFSVIDFKPQVKFSMGTGGTGGYTYAWSNGATTANLSNVGAGSYTCTVTDGNGCTTTSNTVNITEPTALNASLTGTDISCNGLTDGSVALSVSGGTSGYTYAWSNGVTTANLNNIASGNYTCTVTDANSCTVVSNNVTVSEPTVITISNTTIVNDTNVIVNNSGNGSVDITPSGGTPPYQYLWSNGDVTQSIMSLDSGSYALTVTDNNGCVETFTFTVTSTLNIGLQVFKVNLYPNPAGDYINIESDKIFNGYCQIFNLQGQLVMEDRLNSNNTRLDITRLSKGGYLLKVILDGGGTTFKFLKN